MSDPKLNLVLSADDKTAAAFGALNNRLKNVERTAKQTTSSIQNFGQIAGGVFAADRLFEYSKAIANTADTYKQLSARIKIVSDSTEEFEAAQRALFNISQSTRTGFAETADLYAQMARGMRDMNVPQEKMLTITEGINKAIIVSGTSTQAANAALVQLGQGFAAGALRGQEFMSVQEQAPVILETVRNGLGLTQKELKNMAEEGRLTNEVFIQGFTRGMDGLDAQFKQMPVTVSQSVQLIKNSLISLTGTLDEFTGASSGVSRLGQTFADFANFLSETLSTGMKYKGIVDLRDQAKEAREEVERLANVIRGKLYRNMDVTADIARMNEAQARNARLQSQAKTADIVAFGDVVSPPVFKLPKKQAAPVDESAQKKQQAFLDRLQKQYDSLVYSDRELVRLEASRLGVNVQQALSLFDQAQAVRDVDAASKAASEEAKKRLQDIMAAGKEQDANNERQQNVIAGFRNQMQAYQDMLAVRSSGALLSQEEIAYQERLNQLNKSYAAARLQIEKVGGVYMDENLEKLYKEYDINREIIKQIKEKAVAQKNDLFGGFTSGMNTYFQEITDFAKFTEDATVRAFKGMEDALVTFVQTGKLNFGDLARSIIADIARIYVRQTMIAPILGAIGGAFGGSSVSPFSLGYSNATSDPIGTLNYMQGWTGQKRAMGGPVTAGKTYLVGERGPELFTAQSSGQIMPNGSGGGSVNIIQNINVSTGVQQTVRAEVMSLMPQIAGAAKAAVADAKLRGGSYAAALR